MKYRYSTQEYRGVETRVIVLLLGERKMAMISLGNSRFVFRGGFLLALLFLFLAGAGQANAQASAQCSNQGVGVSTSVNVISTAQFCQEFNDVTLTAIDVMVRSVDVGCGGW